MDNIITFNDLEYKQIKIISVNSENELGDESLLNCNINVFSFVGIILRLLPEFDIVFNEYGNYKMKCTNTRAFGKNENIVLFMDYKNDLVTNIWFKLDIYYERELLLAFNIIKSLIIFGDFIISDWRFDFISELSNYDDIKEYLDKLYEIFRID